MCRDRKIDMGKKEGRAKRSKTQATRIQGKAREANEGGGRN